MRHIPLLLLISVFGLLTIAQTNTDTDHLTFPYEEKILESIYHDHPGIILTDQKLAELKLLSLTDENLVGVVEDVITKADHFLEQPPVAYVLNGPRLLSVSVACLDCVRTLSLAYRWTGDEKYAEKALENILAACEFPNWNPSHFLDTAEMSHAVGLGYDWLYDYLDEETKMTIRKGLIEHGITPALEAYENNAYSFPTRSNNWNQVCNGGMIIAALAIANDEPNLSSRILTGALNSLPRAMELYAPDGAWLEGPGYWYYATSYACYAFSALETALGSDFGFSETPGFSETGYFPIYTAGPTNRFFNFADASEGSSLRRAPCLFYLSSLYEEPVFASVQHDLIRQNGASAEDLMWYVPDPDFDMTSLPLDRYFGGPVEVITMRSAWDDPDALFVAIKAGYNQAPHGHLDLGSFEFDLNGVRWAVDIGRDDYNLPGYWRGGVDGQRWDYYRLNSMSHNVITINGESQHPEATSDFWGYSLNDDQTTVIAQIHNAYPEIAELIKRGLTLDRDRSSFILFDQFTLSQSCDITWGMTTKAEIEILENGRAMLSQDGKLLMATIISPENTQFSVGSCLRDEPEKSNEEYSRLLIELEDVSEEVLITVKFEAVEDIPYL